MEHGCEWYTHLLGRHPQTGAELDQWGCSIGWLPILLIENAQQSRQTGAAVESFRNEMVTGQERATAALAAAMMPKAPGLTTLTVKE